MKTILVVILVIFMLSALLLAFVACDMESAAGHTWSGLPEMRMIASSSMFGSTCMAIAADNSLWGRSQNLHGQLGDGTTISRHYFVQIGTRTDWATVATGIDHTVAIKTDGSLWAWGSNNLGQLGDGTGGRLANTGRHEPIQVGIDTDWVSIAAGGSHNVAIRADGSLWAWGINSDGQLGDGTRGPVGTLGAGDRELVLEPTQIGEDLDWAFVAASYGRTMAIRTDGTLWGWGQNARVGFCYGALGLGDDISARVLSPTQVGTDTDWAYVSMGSSHGLAIKTDGTLWAWGNNLMGQLGNGAGGYAGARSTVPIQVGTDTDWVKAAAGRSHSIAIKSDGTLWGWGSRFHGQFDSGISTGGFEMLGPVQFAPFAEWVYVATGSDRTTAICANGSIRTWGS